MKRLNNLFIKLEDYISGGFIIVGLTILFLQVIMRYFLGLSTTWQDEAARYFIIWGVLLGSAVAIRDNQHIKVDVVYQVFSGTIKNMINILSNIFVLLFLVFMVIYGAILVKDKYLTGEYSNIGIQLFIVYAILPLSGFFMAIRTLGKIIGYKNLD
ncbi:TRAP transporter small permease [Pseudogracilibacillus auburnensis]|uniref:C4-dicarboxylate transporter DctQ subunit n=1 Tax=Pseudogracilibacillus auburnensis TaxID=1494959 RepID=A0A2V3VNM3_9BACI|nr:TRAP transporter small permease [Pseudogracilibacillus auburnensis]MBO1001808.1 TRAP transporter small permease [Pseudogracilibacillus auburnensis]PXW83406.1 C4-dicarboxylate transporter DctQ subunit [Pseudogracilibacillus auburnensis]